MIRRLARLWLSLLAFAAPARANAVNGPLLLDAAVAGDAIVAVGELGLIRRSPDDGATWTDVPSGVATTLCAVTFADARHGWAAGHGAVILQTTDGGRTWTRQFTGPDPESPLLDLLALDGQHVIAVGAFGAYFETQDGGATWHDRAVLAEDMHLNRISRTADGTLFIAGESGTLLRSRDAGQTWAALSTDDDGSLYGVLDLGKTALLAYGLRGRVYRSDNEGDSWAQMPTPGHGLLMTGILLPGTSTVVLAGQARTFWTSRDGGRTFRPATDSTNAIAELLLTPSGTLLTIGEAGARPAPAIR